MPKKQNRLLKTLMIIAGTISVGFAVLGIIVPLLPTTPLLLLAAALYARSSERFYSWLLNNRLFGKYIRNYREGRGIPVRVKVISIGFLWITIITSVIFTDLLWVRIFLILIAAGVTLHILSVRSRP
ncbi:MAG TPA: YbaN family protein [Bacteroidales bacterium]|nr:YbaN family protein [Bacteroidales bacterium]HNS46516.1 YbaN family protein [Bacteroidales bacterium]